NFLRLVQGEPYNILSIIGHGRDDLLWLADGALCGRSRHPVTAGEAKLPACAQTGLCFKPTTRTLPVWKLLVRHIFVNSCYGGKVSETLFDPAFSLGLALLDGHVITCLGSTSMVDGREFLNHLYIALLKSGVSTGEAAAFVNQAYADAGLGHPYAYYLLGDPTQQAFSHQAIMFELPPEGWLVTNIPRTSLVILDCGSEELGQMVRSGRVRLTASTDRRQTIYGVFRKTAKGNLLYLFSNQDLGPGRFEVRVEQGRAFNFAAVESLGHLDLLKINPDQSVMHTISDLRGMGLNLARDVKYGLTMVSKTREIYERHGRFEEKVREVARRLAAHLLERIHAKGWALDEHSLDQGVFFDRYEETETPCPNCDRPLYLLRYKHAAASAVRRVYHTCSVCGIVRDYPDREHPAICLSGSSLCQPGEVMEQAVIIRNITSSPLDGWGGLVIVSGAEQGFAYEPALHRIQLEPGWERRLTTSIHVPPSCIPHNYWIRACLVLDGLIWSLKKDIWVHPSQRSHTRIPQEGISQ
ncbi:MAG: hypothetical protein M1598_05180, partial [Actinobacteria bacterium]|nr:hypothetical protein [Actinomycetota bacterium]